MKRLDGFMVYGFRLSVKLAKLNGRKPYWRWVKSDGHVSFKHGEVTMTKSDNKGDLHTSKSVQPHVNENGESSNQARSLTKKIVGHVEVEDLRKMKRCLVGEMATICSVKSITMRLQEWGLGDIKIQRMGGKDYLISIEDDELYIMLEDLDWLYLKEIFSERVAEIWGSFEALGVNDSHMLDCEKVTILISTKQARRIEEVIEIEVEDMVYEVSGFKDNTSNPLISKENMCNRKCVANPSMDLESQSESLSETEKESSPVPVWNNLPTSSIRAGSPQRPKIQSSTTMLHVQQQAVKDNNGVSIFYPMLTPLNYTVWAIKIEAILDAQGVWEAVEPAEGAQVDAKKDKKARVYILQCIPEDLLLQIAKKKTAKEI
ncbi:hypothetical protein V6N13_108424 [Hibiscus sabdariffa]